MVDIRPGFQV